MAVTARYGSYGTLWQSGSLWQLRHFMTVVARYGSHETLWKIWHVMAVVAHYGTLWQLWHVMTVVARYGSRGTLWQLWHFPLQYRDCYAQHTRCLSQVPSDSCADRLWDPDLSRQYSGQATERITEKSGSIHWDSRDFTLIHRVQKVSGSHNSL